jgi:hypothetical protein
VPVILNFHIETTLLITTMDQTNCLHDDNQSETIDKATTTKGITSSVENRMLTPVVLRSLRKNDNE